MGKQLDAETAALRAQLQDLETWDLVKCREWIKDVIIERWSSFYMGRALDVRSEGIEAKLRAATYRTMSSVTTSWYKS
jgi:hypothetical protein